jgi:hypothetical protein
VRPTTLDIEGGKKVIVPRFLVAVDTKSAALARIQERLKDGPTRVAPPFACESKQARFVLRKGWFEEAMLENISTRSPRRMGDFVVFAMVQLLLLTTLLLLPL